MTGRTAVSRRVAVGAALALTAGLGWVGTGAASAATPPLVNCASSGLLGFAPGLTMVATNNTAKISGTLTSCTGKGGVKSGTFTGSVPIGSQSCLSVLSPARALGTGTMTVKFKPSAKGNVTINGTFKMSVCSAQKCQLETQEISVTVTAK